MRLKKIAVLILTVIIAVCAFTVVSSAAKFSDIKTVKDGDYYVMQTRVNLKGDLTISKNKVLVIPKGKRLTLYADKTLTVNGCIIVENGASLIVRGTCNITKTGAIFSGGNTNVKRTGALNVKGGKFFTSGSGSFYKYGSVSSTDGGTLACEGKTNAEHYVATKLQDMELTGYVSTEVDRHNWRTVIDSEEKQDSFLPMLYQHTNGTGEYNQPYVTVRLNYGGVAYIDFTVYSNLYISFSYGDGKSVDFTCEDMNILALTDYCWTSDIFGRIKK